MENFKKWPKPKTAPQYINTPLPVPIPQWKVIGNISKGDKGAPKPNFLKESMKLNWIFHHVGGGFETKNLSVCMGAGDGGGEYGYSDPKQLFYWNIVHGTK